MTEPLPAVDDTYPVPPLTPRTGFLSVLQNRNFLEIWLAQVTSQTAQNSLWYALIIMVGAITGEKPVTVGFTIIMVQLPTVLFSSVSGVFVDRLPKRSILIGTNVLRVVGVLGYLLLQHNLAGLYVITFVVAVLSQPFAPAEGSTIPLLVSGEQLITANSLFQLTFMGAQGVGFALAPIAITVLGVTTTLIALSALFAVAALVLIPLPSPTRHSAATQPILLSDLGRRVIHDLLEAIHFIIDDPPLAVALLQLSLAPTLLLLLAEVGPDYVANTLHFGQTSTALFFLLAPAGIGLGLGMFVLGQFGARLRKDRLVLVSLIALGITVIGLAAVPLEASFWQQLHSIGFPIPSGVGFTVTMFPITVLMGLEVAFVNAPAQTIVQERAAPAVRGRVLAMQQTLTAAVAIPPLIVVGGVATLIGVPATLTLTGIAITVIGLVLVYYA
ncbi:MAG TPA: MFS transporter [Chloroflexota bacterium]|nr:MFS transporter [Chloroflexota bacterium]